MPRLSSFKSNSRGSVLPKIINTLPWNVIAEDSANLSASPPSYEIITVNDAKSVTIQNYLETPQPTNFGNQNFQSGRPYLFNTPYLPGTYTVTFSLTNSSGTSYGSITINCSTNPTIQAPILVDSIVTIGTGSVRSYLFSLSNTVSSNGGQGSIKRYSIANLPATLDIQNIDVSGDVSGYISSPTQITLQCTRLSAGGSSTANLLVVAQTINASVSVPVLTLSAQTVTIGTAFTYQIIATNNPTAYYSTALPAGLSLNSTTGVISGVYNGSIGQSALRISANNAGGSSSIGILTLNFTAYVGWSLSSSSPTGTWSQVAMNSTGTQIAAVISTAIWASSDSGATWSSKGTNNYTAVALAGNGDTLLALQSGGVVYRSDDFGSNWVLCWSPPSTVYWSAADVSSNASVMTAVANPGYVYGSANYGASWTQRTPPSSSWVGVAMSFDGLVQAVISNTGYLYTSSNTGASWISRMTYGANVFHSIAMNYAGDRQTVISDTIVYTSSNYGATWTSRYTAPSGYSFSYGTVVMSTDGSKQYIAASGRIYKSTDYGVTWAVDNAPVVDYGGLALSSDGTKGLAASRQSVANTGRGYKLFV